MARKGQKKLSTTQSLTPEKYLRQRVRSLEIGECYATDMFNDGGGEGVVIVSRKHSAEFTPENPHQKRTKYRR